MEKLVTPANMIYTLLTLIAFLGGIYVSFVILLGLAWGRVDFEALSLALFSNICTLALLVGLVGSFSRRRIFPLFTFVGAAFIPCIAALYLPLLWWRDAELQPGGHMPNVWVLLLIVDITTMTSAYQKSKRLRTSEVTPWQP